MQITARNKLMDLQKYYQQSHLLAIIAYVFVLSFASIVSFIWIRDWIITITIFLCAIIGFIIFSRPSREITVVVNEDGISYDNYILPFTKINSWAMIDLGQEIEFVLNIKNQTQPFQYLYINENEPNIRFLINILRDNIPYDERMPDKNTIHLILRLLRLK